MRQHRTISTAAALLLAAATVIGLAGCDGVNAGSAATEEFDELMADVPEVVDIASSGSNTLPWSGTATAAVLLDDAVTDGRLTEIVDRIGAFLGESAQRSGGASWEGVEVTVRGFSVSVLDRRTDNREQLALLASLEDLGVPGGVLRLGTADQDGARHGALTLVAREGEDFLDAYDLAVSVSEQRPAYSAAVLTGRSADAAGAGGAGADGTAQDDDAGSSTEPDVRASAGFAASGSSTRFSITSGLADDETATGDPSDARAVYTAIATQFAVVGATLSPTAVEARVANVGDVEAATAVAAGVDASGVTVSVQGGIVTWGDGGPSAAMQPVVTELSSVPGVAAIDATSTHLGLVVTDRAAARIALDTLGTLSEASAVETLRVSGPIDTGSPGTFSVAGGRDTASALFVLVEQLADAGLVTSFDGAATRVLVEVRADDEPTLAAAIALVKAAVTPGTSTQLRVDGSQGYWWFDAAETITLQASPGGTERAEETELRERIQRLWNAV